MILAAGCIKSCACSGDLGWNGTDCVTCGEEYKYTCTGTGYVGGDGGFCGDKYAACTCDSGYNWNGSVCTTCDAKYKYSCDVSGNVTGGVGSGCEGLYEACTCADGYIWYDGACVAPWSACEVGDILNSDMSCTKAKEDGKTPIGVVSYVNGSTRLAINLESTQLAWGGTGTDIPELTNYASSSEAVTDFNGMENTSKIVAILGSATNYAAGYCNAYSKDEIEGWFLPADGELYASIWTNKTAVSAGLSAANGTAIANTWHWSSSEYTKDNAWIVFANDGKLSYGSKSYTNGYVRCVLGFEGKTCDTSYQYDCAGDGEVGVGTACDGKYQLCQCAPEYSKTCIGEGYVGGSGITCDGKYAVCTCDSGYNWNGSVCTTCDAAYKYTCEVSGNVTGGIGSSCEGYYEACSCADGYVWYEGACVAPWSACEVGDILNSDMSCTTTKEDGKTPIGIVSYANGDTRLAINLVSTQLEWGGYGRDISGLKNYSSSSTAKNDFSGKSNTSKIVSALGDKSTYAAGYCYNYTLKGIGTYQRQGSYMPRYGPINWP